MSQHYSATDHIDRTQEFLDLYESLTGDIIQGQLEAVDASLGHKRVGYHILPHCLSVALRAVEISDTYDPYELKALLLAGLWHDAGYVPGLADWENVTLARHLWSEHARNLGYTGETIELVSALIGATQFPHNRDYPFTNAALNHREHLAFTLMDADLLQTTEPDRDAYLIGLATEGHITPTYDFPQADMLSTEEGRALLEDYQALLPSLLAVEPDWTQFATR